MNEFLFFPYNGNTIEALDCLGSEDIFIGFIDDDKKKQGIERYGYNIFDRDIINKYPKSKILAAPGNSDNFITRQGIINSLNLPQKRFARIIHPKSSVSKLAEIGFNVLIMSGVVITSNVRIGNHICILPNSVVHHDSVIENYCLIGAGVNIAGNTVIHENCYIGSGSNIINGIEIGEKSLVGLGTNVIKIYPKYSKIIGNPSRIIGKTL